MRPWITFSAFKAIDAYLLPSMRALEYGSGSSSFYFAKKVSYLTSVEHDPQWYLKVKTGLAEVEGAKGEFVLHAPVPGAASTPEMAADPHAYSSSDEEFRGLSFRDYAAFADRFAEGYFDLVMIDGRARPACALHAMRKIKSGGWLVLDNSERRHYHFIFSELSKAGWQLSVFPGPGPWNRQFWETAIWRKP